MSEDEPLDTPTQDDIPDEENTEVEGADIDSAEKPTDASESESETPPPETEREESGDADTDIEALEEALSEYESDGDSEDILDAIDDVADEDEFEFTDDELGKGDYTPEFVRSALPMAQEIVIQLDDAIDLTEYIDPRNPPVTKGHYTWEHFKAEYYYTDYDYETNTGTPPTAGEGHFEDENADQDGVIPFDASEYLGFPADEISTQLSNAGNIVEDLEEVVDKNTVHVPDDVDEDEFFTTFHGAETITTRYDLEKTVPEAKKSHFEEVQRYWVNKPFAFVVIYHSTKENETKYYVIEPYLSPIEENVFDFLIDKLRNTIKYAGEGAVKDGDDDIGRAVVIEEETEKLLKRYGVYDDGGAVPDVSLTDRIKGLLNSEGPTETDNRESGVSNTLGLSSDSDTDETSEDTDDETEDEEDDSDGFLDSVKNLFNSDTPSSALPTEIEDDVVERDWVYLQPKDLEPLHGATVRPEPVLIEENSQKLTEYQVQKVMYYLKRDFVGFQRIDPVKNDINVEDISVDGYNSPVFVYHTDHEQIISNVYHGENSLDEFVVKLAQRSGKGISKRQPQVDTTLPDGSRAQLTLGEEVSDHGTNYTIRQFKDVPFTPIDLVSWKTFSLDQMAFLWLCIENHKSLIFAGGTASGKTTSLNAISLFIPSNAKIVSIEDTREVELPQRNWIASVTRPSFSDDDKGDVDEFDLLEAALRQRPDYIVMGEIRGEEGRTLFQVMSTGHTTYTTFHADSVPEVLKRFTTDPINVSKTMFTALDLVSIQTQTRVDGAKVRRNKTLTEVNGYSAENDEINVQDVYQWQAETDQFVPTSGSSTLETIKFDRGWTQDKLDKELFKRRTVLAYLIQERLNEYAQVAATIQAFIHDPETILGLIAQGKLEESLEDLREMESVLIDIDPEKEDMVPRPTPEPELEQEVAEVMDEARETLFTEIEGGLSTSNLADALSMDEDDMASSPADSESALDLLGNDDDGDNPFAFTGDDDDGASEDLFGGAFGDDEDGDDEDVFGELEGDEDSLLDDEDGDDGDAEAGWLDLDDEDGGE